jgi:hypothetical protein
MKILCDIAWRVRNRLPPLPLLSERRSAAQKEELCQ